jgi:hypothetical protein
MRTLISIVALCLLAGSYFAYRSLETSALSAAYRQRLRELSADYSSLSARYSSVVRQTATTELVVEQGKLSVVVATVDGELRRIATPFDPRGEIHVDYIVRDGRLWIRRVHDSKTPADQALTIDPALSDPNWQEDASSYGLVVYRPLDDGRWVVSVTANGALQLVKKPRDSPPTPLEAAPRVQAFDELDERVHRDVADLSLLDLARGFWDAALGT